MEWYYYVWWPWLTSKCVVWVCQHQLSFLLPLQYMGNCKNFVSSSIMSTVLREMSRLGGGLHSYECPTFQCNYFKTNMWLNCPGYKTAANVWRVDVLEDLSIWITLDCEGTLIQQFTSHLHLLPVDGINSCDKTLIITQTLRYTESWKCSNVCLPFCWTRSAWN